MEKYLRLFFIIGFCFFLLGQIWRIPLPFPGLYINSLDLFVGISISFSAFIFIKNRTSFNLPKPLILFIITMIGSLLINPLHLSPIEFISSSFYILRLVGILSIYLLLKYCIDSFPGFGIFLKKSIEVIAISMAIIGIAQYLIFPDLKPLEMFEWDPHLYRVVGSYLDPGFTGILLLLGLIYLIVTRWHKRKTSWDKFKISLIYISMMFTYSRATYLSFLVAITSISFLKKSPQFLFRAIAIFIITIIILPRPNSIGTRLERQDSIKARIENWSKTIKVIKQYPISGVGFNAYRYAQIRLHLLDPNEGLVSHSAAGADSSILFTFVTTGLVGGIIYSLLLCKFISLLYESGNIVSFISLLCLLAHSLFLNSLYYSFVLFWIAIVVVYERRNPTEPKG